MSIHILDSSTINKIAAGEVIERPASIVKELVENSIDAGASSVAVEIRDGGISLIRVTDNGSGIPAEEVRSAFLRHATSKIESAEDLAGVRSLGFRGEALSSIAAVCRTEIITKTREALTGVRYVIEGGEERSFEEIGAPDGTTMIARDIFYHIPVRRKFLKSAAAEGAHVAEFAEEIALAHPEIAIRFLWNGKSRFGTSGSGNPRDVIYQICGREIAMNLIPVKFSNGGIHVEGFLGKPEISHGSRAMEHYCVNGRYIRSPLISKAIEEGYGNRMMQHSFPFVLLYLTADPEAVDVNVHPTKREVRFSDPQAVYEAVKRTVEGALGESDLIRTVHLKEPGQKQEPGQKKESKQKQESEKKQESEQRNPVREQTVLPSRPVRPAEPFEKVRAEEENQREREQLRAVRKRAEYELREESAGDRQLTFFSLESRAHVRLAGEVFDTYWIAEWNGALYIIDQHAAHEKVNYEHLTRQFREQQVTSQQLMPPIILTLSEREAELLRENEDAFRSIGYEIEPFGGRTFAVRAVPDILPSVMKEDLLKNMIGGLSEEAGARIPELLIEKTASMSCKAAVKGNQHLSKEEAEKLLDEMFSLENPYNCPHGRPTVIRITRQELERRFRRIL